MIALLGGFRLSTWLMAWAFMAAFALLRGQRLRVLLAGAAWLVSFESAYALTWHAVYGHPFDAKLLVGLGWIVLAYVAGVRPSRLWALATVASWGAWLALGFPTSDAHTWSWPGEIANVAAKTAWALTFLWPLLRGRVEFRLPVSRPGWRGDAARVAPSRSS